MTQDFGFLTQCALEAGVVSENLTMTKSIQTKSKRLKGVSKCHSRERH